MFLINFRIELPLPFTITVISIVKIPIFVKATIFALLLLSNIPIPEMPLITNETLEEAAAFGYGYSA